MSLILVDGSALIYRAYYAFSNRPLTAPDGELTSVAFGFLNSSLRLIEKYTPDYFAVVFDLKAPTFRHKIYTKYKANRKPMPEDLAAQIPRLREILAAWGVAVLELAGYEADDVMATLARQSEGVVDHAWFYTGDKDFMQLLNERIGMLKPGQRSDDISRVAVADVVKRFGVQPAQLIDVFALSGDSSDNIPGAPGVGEKTATNLIRKFHDLEKLYDSLEDKSLTPRLRRILTENREQVYLSRQLFTIDSEVPVDFAWDDLHTCLPIPEPVGELLDRLGLRRIRSLIDKLAAQGIGVERARSSAAQVTESTAAAPEVTPVAASVDVVTPETAKKSSSKATKQSAGEPDRRVDPDADLLELEKRGYLICSNQNELSDYLGKLQQGVPLAVDTETSDVRSDTARLVGISLAASGLPAVYIPVLTRDIETPESGGTGSLFALGEESSGLDWIQPLLAPILGDEQRLKVGQNIKYDEWILSRHGLPLAGPRFDTMIAAYVLDPGRQRFNLGELATTYLGEEVIPYADLFAAKDRRRDILSVPLPRLALYAAEDADVTFRIYEVLGPALEAAELKQLFTDVEMPLSAVLFRMERNGIKIDTRFLGKLRTEFAAALVSLTTQIHAVAGEEFNVQSPQQLSRILFDKLRLKPIKKTATGWSTDSSVLSVLAEQHELPVLVLEYRQLAKLQNTYVETLPDLVNPETGLIHTSFNQAVAATGRLSSSDPNLQNIPIRTELGRSIRRAFVPRAADHLFLSADYSQVELRLLAHLSGDAALVETFHQGGDVHRRTAALIAGVAEADVTSELRSRAKAINFGVIYGMGALALAKQISVTTAEAKRFIDSYFATYPGVKAWIDATKEAARSVGYVETLFGRRRWLPDILSENNRWRSFAERVAVNTPIQGTAADIIKMAMIRVDASLTRAGLRSVLLLQVHDELLLEIPRQEMEAVRQLLKEDMEHVVQLNVPLLIDIHTGPNWAEAHD
ncbi:MAG: DNA polymerase I [bacterium]